MEIPPTMEIQPKRLLLLLTLPFLLSFTTATEEQPPTFAPGQSNDRTTFIMQQLMKNYQSSELPSVKPTVQLSQWIIRLERLSTTERTLTFDAYLIATWLDHRLNFKDIAPTTHIIKTDSDWTRRIWQPAINYVNAKSFRILATPQENLSTLIYANGTVWTNVRAMISIPCKLTSKECDQPICQKAHCYTTIESYRYGSSEITLKYAPDGLLFRSDDTTVGNGWNLVNERTSQESVVYRTGTAELLRMEFTFDRILHVDD